MPPLDYKQLASRVLKEIKSLTGDNRIDISMIKNGEQLAILAAKGNRYDMSDQRWHGGGISNITGLVLAGMNITITGTGIASDPYIINSSGGGGIGTVTSVSVVSANGISGTVATATTTPAITLDINALDATKIANGSVSNTEFQYLDGVTSAIQTQLNSKAATLSGTINQIAYFDSSSTIASLTVATYPSLTEFSYVKGVTSAIQTQINAKGTGTVTAVSIATANGVSGSSSGGATPALTIVLGVITPTSVNGITFSGTGSIANTGTTALTSFTGSGTSSGSNTGDQDLTSYATLASPTFTGTPAAPTAAALTNTTQIATTAFVQQEKIGYTIQASGAVFSPVDATTYYFGPFGNANPGSTADISRIYIPKSGTIKAAYVFMNNAGTLGTSETSTIAIRLNNTTDTTITSSLTTSSVSNAFNNTALAIAVVAGDYIEIKWTTPTWATNPTNVRPSVLIYIA